MKRVFIANCTKNKSPEEIKLDVKSLEKESSNILQEGIRVIGNNEYTKMGDSSDRSSLKHVGETIYSLINADVVMFGKNWETDRECSLIHQTCLDYGMYIIYSSLSARYK